MDENTVEKTAVPEPAENPEMETQTTQDEVDPTADELDKIERGKRSKLEKLEYTKARIEEQRREERKKNGMGEEDDLDKPLTRRDLERLRASEAAEDAYALAEKIENENERELVKHYLESVIRPSGSASEDLKNAQAMVYAVKNRQLAEESLRTREAKRTVSAAGAPPREEARPQQMSKQDEQLARAFGLSNEEINKALQ